MSLKYGYPPVRPSYRQQGEGAGRQSLYDTVGKNINEVERMACEYIGCKYAVALSAGTASLHLAMKLAGIEAYGMPKVGHGALEGKKVFCSDMTFDATVNPVVTSVY